MIRVLIAASSAVVRAGLESLLRAEDIDVVGRAATLDDVAPLSADTRADVLVAELDETADEVPPELGSLTSLAGLPVVLLADPPSADWCVEALRSGIRAIMPREVNAVELAGSVRAAGAGLVAIHPQFIEVLLPPAGAIGREPATSEPAQLLTPREVEVLRMLADGLGNKIIAYRLGISEHTVKFHVASVMAKLHAGSRTEAVTLGIRRGLIMI